MYSQSTQHTQQNIPKILNRFLDNKNRLNTPNNAINNNSVS